MSINEIKWLKSFKNCFKILKRIECLKTYPQSSVYKIFKICTDIDLAKNLMNH